MPPSQLQKNSNNLLSLIVPAYKEEKVIKSTLEALEKTLKSQGLKYEIICVVDGILDKTLDNANKVRSDHIRILSYSQNQGKGHAVRYGMSKAKGDIVGFMDANGVDPETISMLLQHFHWYGADIIVGSKRHPASKVVYPPVRRALSFFSQVIIRILFGIQVKDTQVGAKIFRREVIDKILPRMLVKDWAFDVEMLTLANYFGFYNIYEAPIKLELSASRATSHVMSKGFFRSVMLSFKDTLAIFYRLHIRHYYDDKNKKFWISYD